MEKQNQKTKITTLHILERLYTKCSMKEVIWVLISKATKISKKVTFTHAFWVNSGRSKWEKLKSGHYTSWKWYIEGTIRKKQYHCNLHLEFQNKVTFTHGFFFVVVVFFYLGFFFHDHLRITGLQGMGEGISITPHYHFHPLHRHLDISRAITAESSPLHIGRSRTRTGNLCGFRAQVANH